MVGAIGANLQNGRGGASTVHYTAYDPEVEVIQKLRHPMTPASKKIGGCHYSFGTNKFFARKVAKNEDFYLFSYKDVPELYEAQYSKDPDLFEKMYNAAVQKGGVVGAKLNAREVALSALTQSYETGVQYLHMTDMLNQHTPFLDTIYSSNLCQEIAEPTKGFDSVADLYRDYQDLPDEVLEFEDEYGNIQVLKMWDYVLTKRGKILVKDLLEGDEIL
jgi:ribonucleoside-diphosphate reductase alpha chain